METMAAMADEIIVPAVYEVTLNGKVSRDDVSSKMLDIIFDNPSYDFITAFDFGGSGTELRNSAGLRTGHQHGQRCGIKSRTK